MLDDWQTKPMLQLLLIFVVAAVIVGAAYIVLTAHKDMFKVMATQCYCCDGQLGDGKYLSCTDVYWDGEKCKSTFPLGGSYETKYKEQCDKMLTNLTSI